MVQPNCTQEQDHEEEEEEDDPHRHRHFETESLHVQHQSGTNQFPVRQGLQLRATTSTTPKVIPKVAIDYHWGSKYSTL